MFGMKAADRKWRELDEMERVFVFVIHTLEGLEKKGLVAGMINSPRIAKSGKKIVGAMRRANYRPTDEQIQMAMGVLASRDGEVA